MAATDYTNGGTFASDSTVGTLTWSSPSNATSSDDSRASTTFTGAGQVTHYLKATNFSFAVPATATITGVILEVEQTKGVQGVVIDNSVKLVKGGTISGDDKATATTWPTNTDVYQVYGSGSDLWGLTLTPTDINDSGFGAAVSCKITAGTSAAVSIDHIRIKVYYSMPSVQTLTVTAEGGVTSGWAAEGGDYTRIQSDDGDTSRLYTPTTNDIRTLTMSNTSGLGSATIHSVTVHAKVRSLDPVSNTMQMVARISSTDYTSETYNTHVSTSYIQFTKSWTTNPATGVAWTTSDIDGLELGLKKINSAGMGWSYMYAEVDYTAGAVATNNFLTLLGVGI